MTIRIDDSFLRSAIRRLETNIEYVERSNMCDKEKEVLKRSYKKQLKKHREKLMSFYPEYQH